MSNSELYALPLELDDIAERLSRLSQQMDLELIMGNYREIQTVHKINGQEGW